MAANQESKEENYYYLTIDSSRMIDAGPKGNLARSVLVLERTVRSDRFRTLCLVPAP